MTTARKSLKGINKRLTVLSRMKEHTPHTNIPHNPGLLHLAVTLKDISSSLSLQRVIKSESSLLFLTSTKSIYLGISLTMFNILCDPLPLQGVTPERAFLAYHIHAITFPVAAFSLFKTVSENSFTAYCIWFCMLNLKFLSQKPSKSQNKVPTKGKKSLSISFHNSVF